MSVTILFFGMATDLVDEQQISFPLSEKTTLENFKTMLFEKYKNLNEMHQFAIAINEEYATESSIINPGDTIAIIPPVSGG